MHKSRKDRVCLRLVLVQKRTRLEFLRRKTGRLYTGESVNMGKVRYYKYKAIHVIDE